MPYRRKYQDNPADMLSWAKDAAVPEPEVDPDDPVEMPARRVEVRAKHYFGFAPGEGVSEEDIELYRYRERLARGSPHAYVWVPEDGYHYIAALAGLADLAEHFFERMEGERVRIRKSLWDTILVRAETTPHRRRSRPPVVDGRERYREHRQWLPQVRSVRDQLLAAAKGEKDLSPELKRELLALPRTTKWLPEVVAMTGEESPSQLLGKILAAAKYKGKARALAAQVVSKRRGCELSWKHLDDQPLNRRRMSPK
jgi:hypothetical protein